MIATTRDREGATMITFRLRLPCRTILRVFSRNPLVRGTDRLEAVVMLLAVTVSLPSP
ncbi:hypothetical protein ABLN72_15655, partial [Mycobacterium tuberculosis]